MKPITGYVLTYNNLPIKTTRYKCSYVSESSPTIYFKKCLAENAAKDRWVELPNGELDETPVLKIKEVTVSLKTNSE